MATPISAFLRAGASFTPSPVIATICLFAWIASTSRILCSGLARANTSTSRTDSCNVAVSMSSISAPRDRGPAITNAQHLGDRRGGDFVIAGDHRHSDTAVVTLLHGLDGLLARRIQETDQTEQHQVLRQVRRTKSPRPDAWVLQPCEAQHALPALRAGPMPS